MCQKFFAIIHQLAAITSDKELLKKLPAKYWFVNLLPTHSIKNYLRKTACKILLWKNLPGNFVPMFPCLCTPGNAESGETGIRGFQTYVFVSIFLEASQQH